VTPSGPRRGEKDQRPGQPKATTINRVRDYKALEREYITGNMSLQGLCRRHGVTAHGAVVVQARQGNWVEKRRTYLDRASSTYIERHADRAAAREAEVRDHALDAIDEAITKFRADLRATERKLINSAWVEVPAVRVGPRDLALLIDRLQILFGRPAMISEGRGLAATVTSESVPSRSSRGSSRRPVGWRARRPPRRRPRRDCTVGPTTRRPGPHPTVGIR
jgi:hypothetical protein